MKLNCGIIEIGSVLYNESVSLRDEVLRKPLGLSFTEIEKSKESNAQHLGIFEDGAVVGVLLMTPLSAHQVKMRQVAIHPEKQGGGLGKKLILYSEEWATQNGFKEIVLNARSSAVPFYLKLGYLVDSDEFTEVGIPHFKMKKSIG